jgi:hypothetical protein
MAKEIRGHKTILQKIVLRPPISRTIVSFAVGRPTWVRWG